MFKAIKGIFVHQFRACIHCSMSFMLLSTLQVPADHLKDRQVWASGWLQKAQLDGAALPSTECRTCNGSGVVYTPYDGEKFQAFMRERSEELK